MINPFHIAARGASVAVLGATTGSHLDLPDDQELGLRVIWVGHVIGGLVSQWRIVDDTPQRRVDFGVPAGV